MYNEELNYNSLTNEIDTLKVILNRNIVECFDDILKCVKSHQHQLMMMPSTVNLSKLLLVNPATSATAERSFSLARRLKLGCIQLCCQVALIQLLCYRNTKH